MPSAPNLNPPASSVAVHAAIFRHPMWALTPQRGENLNPERGSEQVKCVSARAAAEFHGAFDRGLAVELTREPGESIGVMLGDVGTVEEITAAGSELHEPEWRRAMAEKFFWQRGKDDTAKVSGELIEQAHDAERDGAQAEHLDQRPAGAGVSQSERDWAWCRHALRSGLHPAIVEDPVALANERNAQNYAAAMQADIELRLWLYGKAVPVNTTKLFYVDRAVRNIAGAVAVALLAAALFLSISLFTDTPARQVMCDVMKCLGFLAVLLALASDYLIERIDDTWTGINQKA